MKIGILTFHWATNHGGILQAYALQRYLSEAIPNSDVCIIDYWPARYQKSIKRAVRSRHPSRIINNLNDVRKEKNLASFRAKMKKTYRYYSEKQLREFPPQVDVLITGSDQIWNEFYTMNGEGGVTTSYFLPFQPNARRISYAASFGVISVKPEMETVIKPLLEKFDAISVREQTGKEILNKMGINAVVVCDPTLLLKSDAYETLCRHTINGEYIAEYILRAQSRETLRFISEIERQASQVKKIANIGLLSIEEWLGAIKNASCLVTNSFHGVVFALKFHTPFFAVLEKQNLRGMNDRFYTLLDVVGLKDRIVSDVSQVKEQIVRTIDWEQVDERLNSYAEASMEYLLSNCRKNSQKRVISFYKRAECCGCGACAQVCPRNCIEMVSDSEGFLYPKIKEDECVKCGKCYDVCHIKNGVSGKEKISETFYAKTEDKEVRFASSSGGIFTELAKSVLQEHGVVFGASFSSDFSKVQHISIHSVEDLERLRGSKYLQSEIGDSFVEAKEYLDDGRKVLFSGTPCQIRGLKSFLKKDYPNLISVEVICHGVPSPKVWNIYLNEASKKSGCEVSDVSFRCKENGWKNFSMNLKFVDGTTILRSISSDPYMQAFLKNLSLRPSCYDCVCKETDGVADITLGDAWGIENYCGELYDNKGVSVVFVRSRKGTDIVESVSAKIRAVKAEGFEECLKYNSAMRVSVSMPPQRESFFAEINRGVQLQKVVKRYCKTPLILKAKRLARKVLKMKK